MIDHMTLHVRDAARSIDFYTRALAPLGYVAKAHHGPTVGFGTDDGTPHSDFYVSPTDGAAEPQPTHIAFLASGRDAVRAFHEAAIAAGGRDNGAPGPRDYHPGYYSAFVLDPDGNNIEAVVDWAHADGGADAGSGDCDSDGADAAAPGERLRIGSHLSTTGGWDAILERSRAEGGTAFAFFPRSPYGSRSKALDPDGAAAFGRRLAAAGYGPIVVHAPYVYNLAGKDPAKRDFAVRALAEDIRLLAPIRAAGQETYVNIHPGAHVGQGAETGCRLIAEGLGRVLDSTAGEDGAGITVLLETMAGKGTECGRSFDELAAIIDGVDAALRPRLGVTLDTCHVFDAGYDLLGDFDGVIGEFDRTVGLARLRAIHVNDSQFGLGSRKDRHANIGDGMLGLGFFRRLVNDPRLDGLPMILETKELTETTHRDEIALLRGLAR